MSSRSARLFDRRALAKELTRLASAGVREILADQHTEAGQDVRLIGITGPPGAGKSTLISRLAEQRLQRIAPIAVVAIDPTSPRTRGSLLGDRVRMDSLSDDPRVFIRSLPSRSAADGLTHNLAEMVAALARFGFPEVLLETVGVGQSAYGVRVLADVEVLVLTPGAGDSVQAMKAGIMETADILVVNKSELPGSDRLVSDLLGVARSRTVPDVPVIQVRAGEESGVAELSRAIDECVAAGQAGGDTAQAHRRARRMYRVQRLLERTLLEVLQDCPGEIWEAPLRETFLIMADGLCARAHVACQPTEPDSVANGNAAAR